MLQCQALQMAYPTGRGPIAALQDLTFEVAQGEFLCVVGPSGCGKSTLLRILAGLVQPTAGQVTYGSLPEGTRPRCAMVFQEQGLFPWLTVLENAAFGLEMQGVVKQEWETRAARFLTHFGLAEFIHSYPHELSGGMRQRVGIARAFVVEPDILLMDEPFRALDAQTRLVLQEELLRLWGERRTTVIYVTHDIEEAILLGDRVLVMSGRPGKIRQEVPLPQNRPRDLSGLTSPESEATKWHIWKMLEQEVRQNLTRRA